MGLLSGPPPCHRVLPLPLSYIGLRGCDTGPVPGSHGLASGRRHEGDISVQGSAGAQTTGDAARRRGAPGRADGGDLGRSCAGRHYLLGLLIALGTYPGLFGGVADRRHRLAVMTAAGAGLVVAVTAGVLAAGSLVWTLVAHCAMTLAAAVADEALSLGPPGPAFFVLMVAAG